MLHMLKKKLLSATPSKQKTVYLQHGSIKFSSFGINKGFQVLTKESVVELAKVTTV